MARLSEEIYLPCILGVTGCCVENRPSGAREAGRPAKSVTMTQERDEEAQSRATVGGLQTGGECQDVF